MILSVANKHPFALSLLFYTVKSSCCTFSFSLLFQQLFLELLNTSFGHIKGLHSGVTPSHLLFHLLVAVVGYLLHPEGGLNSLLRKETWIIIIIIIINKRKRRRQKGSSGEHTTARYLFRLRKTSCLLMDRSSAMSSRSKKACSTTSAIPP